MLSTAELHLVQPNTILELVVAVLMVQLLVKVGASF